MTFLRAIAGYRMTNHRREEDIREELRMTDVSWSRVLLIIISWERLINS
jgi:hypothetical protein